MPWAIAPNGVGEIPGARRVRGMNADLAPNETFIVADNLYGQYWRLNDTEDGLRDETPQERNERTRPRTPEERVEQGGPILNAFIAVYAAREGVSEAAIRSAIANELR